MKTLRSLTLSAAALLGLASAALAGNPPGRDTIIVKLKKADKLMLITRPGQSGIKGLQEYDINQILRRVDSTLRASQSMTLSDGKDTTMYIRRIQTFKYDDNGEKKTISISVNTKNGPNIIIKERYDDPDTVYHGDSHKPSKKKRRFERNNDFYINIGLDGYVDKNGNTPDGAGNPYALRPLGSRYVALGYNWAHQFGNSPFGFNAGLEVAWQNFMLQDKYRFVKGPNGLDMQPIGTDTSVSKSKLVQSMVKLPLTLNIAFNHDWSLELGGFAGYRLMSHTKVKYDTRGNTRKDKDYDSFYLSNFQYGLKAQVRYKGIGIFAEYHLNPTFNSSGPDLTAYQFGIRL